MPSEWREARLGDLCEKIGSGATPRGGSEVYQAAGVALIRSQNVYNDGFHRQGLAFIGDDHARELQHVAVAADDVLLNITGDSVARVCMAPTDVLPARVNQHVAVVRSRGDLLVGRYLYYCLVSPLMQRHMLGLAGAGATRNALTKGMVEDFRIPLPSLPVQRSIAGILGALDDKVELNRKMNETLEQMARAVFKSWFVNFEPFRDKGMVDSPLGKIPKAWQSGELRDMVGLLGGHAFSSRDWTEAGVPVVKIGSVKPGIVDIDEVSYVSEHVAREVGRYRLKAGDLLIGMTGYVGEVGLVPRTSPQPLLNQRVGKFLLKKEGTTHLSFVYCLARGAGFKDAVVARAHGTAQANVSAEGILSIPVVVPDEAVRDSFDRTCEPLLARILANHAQSRTLAAIRDALLPKLMSGEVSMEDN